LVTPDYLRGGLDLAKYKYLAKRPSSRLAI